MAIIVIPGTTTEKKVTVATGNASSIPGVSSSAVPGVKQLSNIGSLLQGGLNNASIGKPATVPKTTTSSYASIPIVDQTAQTASFAPINAAIDQAQQTAVSQAKAQQESIAQAAQQTGILAQQKRAANLSTLDQRMAALESSYQSNLGTVNQGFGANVDLAKTQTAALQQQIDQNLGGVQQQGEVAKKNVQEQAATARTGIEDTLRRTFDARGALDSTFYARELASNLSGLEKTKIDQVSQIDQQLTQATQQAGQQKQNVQTQLQQTLSDLENKKADYLNKLTEAYNAGKVDINTLRAQADMDLAEFATNNEIQRINQLQQVQFNLDNYLNDLGMQRANLAYSIQRATGSTVDPFAAAEQRLGEIQSAAVSIIQNPSNRAILQASVTANSNPERAASLLQATDEYISSLTEEQKKRIQYGQ